MHIIFFLIINVSFGIEVDGINIGKDSCSTVYKKLKSNQLYKDKFRVFINEKNLDKKKLMEKINNINMGGSTSQLFSYPTSLDLFTKPATGTSILKRCTTLYVGQSLKLTFNKTKAERDKYFKNFYSCKLEYMIPLDKSMDLNCGRGKYISHKKIYNEEFPIIVEKYIAKYGPPTQIMGVGSNSIYKEAYVEFKIENLTIYVGKRKRDHKNKKTKVLYITDTVFEIVKNNYSELKRVGNQIYPSKPEVIDAEKSIEVLKNEYL